MQRLKNLFLIDDDSIHQQIAKMMLERQGVAENIHNFLDAKQALDFLKLNASFPESLPDVILLDLNMPLMDGWEFLDEFEKIKGSLSLLSKIYILTSSINHHDRERSKQYSAVSGYLVKPLSKKIMDEIAGKDHE
jgi:CheY-like chemotaxis protein